MKKTLLKLTQITVGRLALVDNYALTSKDARVKELQKVERTFKKTYNVDMKVVYVDAKDKALIADDSINGFRCNMTSKIVVFITNDLVKNAETLLHELTHAYQAKYMTKKFNASKKELIKGKVSYRNAWHERHARACANRLIQEYIDNRCFYTQISKAPAYKAVA